MARKLRIDKVYNLTPKVDISLSTEKGESYQFKVGESYPAKFYILNVADIIINSVKVRVNTSWIAENFRAILRED